VINDDVINEYYMSPVLFHKSLAIENMIMEQVKAIAKQNMNKEYDLIAQTGIMLHLYWIVSAAIYRDKKLVLGKNFRNDSMETIESLSSNGKKELEKRFNKMKNEVDKAFPDEDNSALKDFFSCIIEIITNKNTL